MKESTPSYVNFLKLMRIAWKTDSRYFFYLALNFVCSGINTYAIIQLPRIVLEMLSDQSINGTTLITIFSLIILSGFGISAAKILYTPIGFRIRYELLHTVHSKNLNTPLEYFENPKNMDNLWNISRPVTSVQGIQGFYLNLGGLSGNLAIILIACISVFAINPWIALLIISWFFFYTYLMLRTEKKTASIWKQNSRSFRGLEYWADIARDISYAKEFRVFSLKEWYTSKRNIYLKNSDHALNQVYTLSSRLFFYDNIYQILRDTIMYASLIILFFNKSITLAEFSTFGVLIAQLNNALSAGTQNLNQIISHYSNFDALFNYFDVADESNHGLDFVPPPDWIIEFKNVTFRYPNTEKNIYENLCFTIQKGQKIAIIGLNGVGKTTLIKLLMRLYQPTSGSITFNGQDIQEFKLKEYYTLFAPVFQEMHLLAFPIKDNLSFGRDLDEHTIREAFTKVGLSQRMENIASTHPLTKNIDEEGLMLSGGEIQKFSMARAVCSERDVLILDEPTSALDAIAESEFYSKINQEYNNNTILFISHRLASAQFCDEIVLIDDKNIAEKGTHDSLMNKRGKYYNLYMIQSKYYTEDRHEEQN